MRLTDKAIARLGAQPKTYLRSDAGQPGLYIRVQPSGVKTFQTVTRDLNGKRVWVSLGRTTELDLATARLKAREVSGRIKKGEDRAGPQSFQDIAEQWFARHVEKKGLRTARGIRRILDLHILPEWSGRLFTSIKRSDVTDLLDKVEDGSGPSAADMVLANLSRIFTWYATRHDDYASPLVRGMKRSAPKPRERILSDDELRAVWQAAESNGTFGAYLRMLLLTAQRREKVANMRWQDVDLSGVWTIPCEDREKGHAGELRLPEMALAIIKAQPRLASNDYVFAGRGEGPIGGFSKAKRSFEAKLPPMPQWGLHDLRRTARSLMSRAGVRPDIAERVLGHAIKGVEGIYDRHSYAQEKAAALGRLAVLIEQIVFPKENVVALQG